MRPGLGHQVLIYSRRGGRIALWRYLVSWTACGQLPRVDPAAITPKCSAAPTWPGRHILLPALTFLRSLVTLDRDFSPARVTFGLWPNCAVLPLLARRSKAARIGQVKGRRAERTLGGADRSKAIGM